MSKNRQAPESARQSVADARRGLSGHSYPLPCRIVQCPASEKATRLVDVEIEFHDGKKQRTNMVSQPTVDPDLCTGCGGPCSSMGVGDERDERSWEFVAVHSSLAASGGRMPGTLYN